MDNSIFVARGLVRFLPDKLRFVLLDLEALLESVIVNLKIGKCYGQLTPLLGYMLTSLFELLDLLFAILQLSLQNYILLLQIRWISHTKRSQHVLQEGLLFLLGETGQQFLQG